MIHLPPLDAAGQGLEASRINLRATGRCLTT